MDLTKEELVRQIKKFRTQIGDFKVYFNKDCDRDLSIGYYFDKQCMLWISYYTDGNKIRVASSKDEIKILESVYEMVCDEVEAHTDTLDKIKRISEKFNSMSIPISIYLNECNSTPYAEGYYYDSRERNWKVYLNGERGDTYVYGSYKHEKEAMVHIYKMANSDLSAHIKKE